MTKHPCTKLAHATITPFHSKTDEKPILYNDDRISSFGFPKPGIQSPTPSDAMAAHFFVDKATWSDIVAHGEFDDVVVGSGFCALAYVDEAFKRDPFRKILILERGGKCLRAFVREPIKLCDQNFGSLRTCITSHSLLKGSLEVCQRHFPGPYRPRPTKSANSDSSTAFGHSLAGVASSGPRGAPSHRLTSCASSLNP